MDSVMFRFALLLILLPCFIHAQDQTEPELEPEPAVDQAPDFDTFDQIPVENGVSREPSYFPIRGVNEPDIWVHHQIIKEGRDLSFPVPENATPALAAVRFDGPVRGLLLHNPDEPAIGDSEALIAAIIAGAETDREKADRIFMWVVENYQDWWFTAEGLRNIRRFPKNIATQIWGYGHGFCSDASQILVAMWRHVGFPARITNLHPRHTVATVDYDGASHVYDVQHRSFWEKPDGQVASEHELRENPEWFVQNLDEYGYDPIGYPPALTAKWYGDTEFRYSEAHDWELNRDFRFNLREDESYEIHYIGKPFYYHPDLWRQYYGETTLTRDPPWPFRGRLRYEPKENVDLQTLTLADQRTAYAITMQSPYLFTEGTIQVPGLNQHTEIYVWAHDELHYLGPMISGIARLKKHIAGTYRFAVYLVPPEPWENPQEHLAGLELDAYTQMSPIGLPRITAGRTQWATLVEAGEPRISVWYRNHGPDLEVTFAGSVPEHPKPGENVQIRYTVRNTGTGASLVTAARLRNLTTALLAESEEIIGDTQIPPLAPGEQTEITFWWTANTRQTWYGQNPSVQRFEIRIDEHKERIEADRSNNELQHYLHLSQEGGQPAPLPGYSPIGLKSGKIYGNQP